MLKVKHSAYSSFRSTFPQLPPHVVQSEAMDSKFAGHVELDVSDPGTFDVKLFQRQLAGVVGGGVGQGGVDDSRPPGQISGDGQGEVFGTPVKTCIFVTNIRSDSTTSEH